MNFAGKYNTKSTGVKRLMREAFELKDPCEDYYARPLEDNLFEWHFTVRGPADSDFEGGIYHGRILLPPEYPMQPPNIIMLTPNGRFEVNKKICLSISGHHPETWLPSWSIRTALLAIIAFMPTPGNGTIGSLDYTCVERQKLARKSQSWECSKCGKLKDLVLPNGNTKATDSSAENDTKKTTPNDIEWKVCSNTGEATKATKKEAQNSHEKANASPIASNGSSSCTNESETSLAASQKKKVATSNNSVNSFINIATAVIIFILAFLIYRRLYLK